MTSRSVRTMQQLRSLQCVQQAFFHFRILHVNDRLSTNKNKIEVRTNLVRIQANNFLHHPSDPVAHHGASELLADRYTHPKPLDPRIRQTIDNYLLIGGGFSVTIHFIEIFPASQPKFLLHPFHHLFAK